MEGPNLFSSDDATEQGYDSLEDRVFKQQIDNDKVEYKPIWLRGWQTQALRFIKSETGSNETDVTYALYIEGSIAVRDEVGHGRVKDLVSLSDSIRLFFGSSKHFGGDKNRYRHDIVDNEASDPLRGMGEIVEQTTAKLPDSVYSEVKDTYEVEGMFGPWIHRAIIAMGFRESKVLGESDISDSKDVAKIVCSEFKSSRDTIESNILDVLLSEVKFWLDEGIYRKQISHLEDISSLMNTRRGEVFQRELEIIKDEAEVLENEFGDGSDTTQGTL